MRDQVGAKIGLFVVFVQAEFLANVGTVVLNCLGRDVKCVGDLFAGLAFFDQCCNLQFTRGKLFHL